MPAPITTTQFLDLNEKVGGYDQDFNYVATRSVGNHGAMKRAQEAGLQLGANGGLEDIPIFDMTGLYDDDGGYHYQWFHFSFRERLIEANGNARNHVMWRGNPVPFDTAWSSFIDWVVAYTSDTSNRSQRERVIHNRPATLVDGCWSDATTSIPETANSEQRSRPSMQYSLPFMDISTKSGWWTGRGEYNEMHA